MGDNVHTTIPSSIISGQSLFRHCININHDTSLLPHLSPLLSLMSLHTYCCWISSANLWAVQGGVSPLLRSGEKRYKRRRTNYNYPLLYVIPYIVNSAFTFLRGEDITNNNESKLIEELTWSQLSELSTVVEK